MTTTDHTIDSTQDAAHVENTAVQTHEAAAEHHEPGGLHISIKADPIAHIGSFAVTNSLLTSLIVTALFAILAVKYYQESQKRVRALWFYAPHAAMRAIYGLYETILHKKVTAIFPLMGPFFFFIVLNNWFGLLPGVGSIKIGEVHLLRAGNADLNGTAALGILTVSFIQFYGVKYLGFLGYLGKFFNFKNIINLFVGLLDIVSEFSRVISFSLRLYGNVFAGEVLLTVVAFLVPAFASFPFFMLEIFTGFIQGLVFTMLSSVFIALAAESHEH